ncbi:histone-lysine N-methyltransferase SETMAR [Trichonephila clavipes]|nr:histone-lysine N-methyltransferase SETMAR [Trichonephila clavipes]
MFIVNKCAVFKNTSVGEATTTLHLLPQRISGSLKEFWYGAHSSLATPVATTDENIAKVHQIVPDDLQIKVTEIAEIMNMSKERVYHILNQHLSMRKLSVRRVPRLLTLDQKRVQMNISKALLAQFRRNKSEFWHRLITVYKTWIHHYTPEAKIQSSGLKRGKLLQKKQKLFFRLGK